jgi:hypothetical protein
MHAVIRQRRQGELESPSEKNNGPVTLVTGPQQS